MNELRVSLSVNDQSHNITLQSTRSNFEEITCDDYIDMILADIKTDLINKYRYYQSPQIDFANMEANECEGCDL